MKSHRTCFRSACAMPLTLCILAAFIGCPGWLLADESPSRYVATAADGGSDENAGTAESPFLTIAYAVESLAADEGVAAGTATGTVYVADGEYHENGSTDLFGPSGVAITAPISVVSLSGDAAKVRVTRDSVNSGGIGPGRVFTLNHAGAGLRQITIFGGRQNAKEVLGGGLYVGSAGGTVEDCVITGGWVRNYKAGGGNVAMAGGRVVRCKILNGTLEGNDLPYNCQGGSGVCMTGGVLENCLVAGCSGGYGAVALRGGNAIVASCDIVGNTSHTCSGVAILDNRHTVKVVNTVIYGNTLDVTATDPSGHGSVYMPYWNGSKETDEPTDGYVANSAAVCVCFENCFAELAFNDTCFTGNPGFTDAANGDYTIGMASCLRDKVADYAGSGALSETDLAGAGRIQGNAADVGCYEYVDSGEFAVDFTFVPRSQYIPTIVDVKILTSGASGVVTYEFDFNGDGEADYETTETEFELPWNLGGTRTIVMSASDSSQTVMASARPQFVFAPKDIYVKAGSSNAEYPYENWETAASDLSAALDLALDGCTIWVGDGLYNSDNKPFTLDKAVSIIGASSDPSRQVITNSIGKATGSDRDRRNLIVNHPKALVANLTLADGASYYEKNRGGNLTILSNGGTVSNCVLHAGFAVNWHTPAGGAYLQGGLLTHSVIRKAKMDQGGPKDKGVAAVLDGAMAKMSNCLIQDVVIDAAYESNVIRVDSGTVENCTVVNCQTGHSDHYGIKCGASGTIKNTVVFKVLVDASAEDAERVPRGMGGTLANFFNCASDDAAAPNATCVTIGEDAFRAFADGDFSPARGSALCDAGAALESYPATDLAGQPRIFGRKGIDIGCYECQLALGMMLTIR